MKWCHHLTSGCTFISWESCAELDRNWYIIISASLMHLPSVCPDCWIVPLIWQATGLHGNLTVDRPWWTTCSTSCSEALNATDQLWGSVYIDLIVRGMSMGLSAEASKIYWKFRQFPYQVSQRFDWSVQGWAVNGLHTQVAVEALRLTVLPSPCIQASGGSFIWRIGHD